MRWGLIGISVPLKACFLKTRLPVAAVVELLLCSHRTGGGFSGSHGKTVGVHEGPVSIGEEALAGCSCWLRGLR